MLSLRLFKRKNMLPRKLHLEQINRFHDAIENIDKQLELEEDGETKNELLIMYFKLTKTWINVDDFTENLKDEIDSILHS
jgi:hypothetical protein